FMISLTHYTPDLPLFPTRRSSDLEGVVEPVAEVAFKHAFDSRPHVEFGKDQRRARGLGVAVEETGTGLEAVRGLKTHVGAADVVDRKSTRLNSSHVKISYAVFCLK